MTGRNGNKRHCVAEIPKIPCSRFKSLTEGRPLIVDMLQWGAQVVGTAVRLPHEKLRHSTSIPLIPALGTVGTGIGVCVWGVYGCLQLCVCSGVGVKVCEIAHVFQRNGRVRHAHSI